MFLQALPLGTFICNLLACGVAFALGGIYARGDLGDRVGSRGGLKYEIVLGAIGGFCGPLASVSTWVVQIYKLMKLWPDRWDAQVNVVLTILLPVLLGVAIYGPLVWSASDHRSPSPW